MSRWRFYLIGLYVALTMAGVLSASNSFRIGVSLAGLGLLSISIHILLERIEDARERKSQIAWEVEIRRVADDLDLAEYGIPSIEELSRYHDSRGRDEVLRTLRSLPEGERSLLVAARTVDPDAEWD